MSEVIPETYIEVRDDGLISASGVTTGLVAVIGTARLYLAVVVDLYARKVVGSGR
jgi:hypothetical protein